MLPQLRHALFPLAIHYHRFAFNAEPRAFTFDDDIILMNYAMIIFTLDIKMTQ